MEAQKLKRKKNSISKSKIKKTIKNVICRPDPVFWPVVTDSEASILQTALEKNRIHIPEFKKPHWNDIKLRPKNERPQPPQIQKVEGLIFGISACSDAVRTQNCSAMLIETDVNPQAIVQPIIEACITFSTSVLCLKNLRKFSLIYFGIRTSCLGIKKDNLHELCNKIDEIFKNYRVEKKSICTPINCTEKESLKEIAKKEDLLMDVDICCPYVYRTDKKSRTFVPHSQTDDKVNNKFTGQHFIKLPQENKPKEDSKTYMKMILKKISNNPNRVKGKK